jgi:hypothetical protein
MSSMRDITVSNIDIFLGNDFLEVSFIEFSRSMVMG